MHLVCLESGQVARMWGERASKYTGAEVVLPHYTHIQVSVDGSSTLRRCNTYMAEVDAELTRWDWESAAHGGHGGASGPRAAGWRPARPLPLVANNACPSNRHVSTEGAQLLSRLNSNRGSSGTSPVPVRIREPSGDQLAACAHWLRRGWTQDKRQLAMRVAHIMYLPCLIQQLHEPHCPNIPPRGNSYLRR